MLKLFFDQIFSLPPVEKRHMWLAHTPFRRFFAEPTFRADMDDTYIYYLCGQWSFIISLALALLNLASHQFNIVFDFFFFKIDITGRSFVERFLATYNSYAVIILLISTIPYFLILYLNRINVQKYDVLWYNTQQSKINKMSKVQFFLTWSMFLAVILITAFGSATFFGIWMHHYRLYDSFGYLIFLCIVMPIVLGAVGRLFLMGIINLIFNFYRQDQVKKLDTSHNPGREP